MNKTLGYYLALPYTVELVPDPDDGWFVAIKELPGCMSQGDTTEEALEMIQDAMEGWLEVALEDGMRIPEPRALEDYSGKFVVRVPRSLHRELVERAEEENTSLNQYINVLLAYAIGDRVPTVPQNDPLWPGLKHSVRHALLCAGMEEDAAALDERLFVEYVENMLVQVESALDGNYIRDAMADLERLEYVLNLAESRSLAIKAFCNTVKLFRKQVESQLLMQKGLVEREILLQAQIRKSVQEANKELVVDVARESRIRYSQVSMEYNSSHKMPVNMSRTSTLADWQGIYEE